MQTVRIIPSTGPTGIGTKVVTADGQEIPGITSISVRFAVDEFVTARIELMASMDPVDALPLLGPETLERSAKAFGFALVPVASEKAADHDEFIGEAPVATGVVRWTDGLRIVGENGPELEVTGTRRASIMEAMRAPTERFEADLSGIYALALPHSWKPWHVVSVAIGAVLALGVAAQILSKLGG